MPKRLVLLLIALLVLSCKLPGALFDRAPSPDTSTRPAGTGPTHPAAGQPAATAGAAPTGAFPAYILVTPGPVLTHGAGSRAAPAAAVQADMAQPATETPTPTAALPTDTPGPTPTTFPLPTQSAAEIPPLTATPERTLIPPPYDPATMRQDWSALSTSSATEAAFLCGCAQVIYVCEKMLYGNRPSCSFRCISTEGGAKYGIGASAGNQFCDTP